MNKKIIIFGFLWATAIVSTSVYVPFILKKNKNNAKIKAANENINKVVVLFDELKNKEKGTVSTLENKSTTLPSFLVNETSAEALGFVDPSINKLNGTTVSFAVKSDSANNQEGKLIVEVSISKKTRNYTKVEFILTGYQTNAQAKLMSDKSTVLGVIQDLVAADFSSIYNDKSKISSEKSYKDETKKTAIVAAIKNKMSEDGEKALITNSLISFSNSDGTLKIKIALSSLGGSGTKDIDITGFKTNAQLANEAIAADKAKFNNFDQTITGTPNAIINGAEVASSLTSLIGHKSMPVATNGVTRKFSINTIANTGIATVTVTFSADHGTDDTTTYKIRGFKTNAQLANEAIAVDKAKFNSFDQTITGTPNVIPNGTVVAVNLTSLTGHESMPVATNGVTRKFSINTIANTGIATVTITFSADHGTDDTTTYKIRGFKTNSQLANEAIAVDKAKFNSFDQTITGTPNVIPNGMVVAVNLTSLTGHESMPVATNGVNRKFSINTANTGIATVTVTFSANYGTDDTTTYKIRGFKTT